MGMEANIETLLKNLARCVIARKRPGRVALLLDLAAKQKFRNSTTRLPTPTTHATDKKRGFNNKTFPGSL
jgi:hypothetical protein